LTSLTRLSRRTAAHMRGEREKGKRDFAGQRRVGRGQLRPPGFAMWVAAPIAAPETRYSHGETVGCMRVITYAWCFASLQRNSMRRRRIFLILPLRHSRSFMIPSAPVSRVNSSANAARCDAVGRLSALLCIRRWRETSPSEIVGGRFRTSLYLSTLHVSTSIKLIKHPTKATSSGERCLRRNRRESLPGTSPPQDSN
jgi:hypothetical protein